MDSNFSVKSYGHVNKMPSLTYNQANIVIIKNAMILNIMHDIINIRGTEVVICIMLVLLKRADDFNQYIHIR